MADGRWNFAAKSRVYTLCAFLCSSDCMQSALHLRSAVGVNGKLMTPQTQVPNVGSLPALDHMVQKYHGIRCEQVTVHFKKYGMHYLGTVQLWPF